MTLEQTSNSSGSHPSQAFNRIPEAMKLAVRWLVHRKKQPFYIDGTPRRGTLDSDVDRSRMATFKDAVQIAHSCNYCGLGFALGPDGTGNYWQGVDLDKIEINSLQELANALPGYVELSPSGLGVHAIGYGKSFPAFAKGGVEAYSSGRFFTVTGKTIRDTL